MKYTVLVLAFLLVFTAVPALTVFSTSYGMSCTSTVSTENLYNNAIQSAINSASPGSTICVGLGTFPEQLTITEPLTLVGFGTGTIIRPSSLSSTVANPDPIASGTPEAPVILAQGTTGVTIEDLAVDGSSAAPAGCGPTYVGILYYGASGTIEGTNVSNFNLGSNNLYGCQSGLGILVQSPSGQTSTVTVTGNTVTNYQKNGITCNDAGTRCNISDNTVSALVAAQPYIAPNGIQVAFGATAKANGNMVSSNECSLALYCGTNLITLSQGTGILVFEAGPAGVKISGNTFSSNDIAIGLYLDSSGSVHLHGNNVLSSRMYGVVVYDESETVSGNIISNAPVGLGVVSDTSGLTAVVSGHGVFSSSVITDCQSYTANGGVATCNIS